MNTTEPDLPEDDTKWTTIKHLSDTPDYETRLRDEVAMRCFVTLMELDTIPREKAAKAAFNEAEAFMAERERRAK